MVRKIIICDSNKNEAKTTCNILRKFEKSIFQESEIQIYTNGTKLLNDCIESSVKPDIIFIDIELDNDNGIDIVKKINHIYPKCHIIYLSNCLQYATDIYGTDHLYFVVKDELEERLPEIQRKIINIEKKANKTIRIRLKRSEYVILNQSEIICLERKGRITYIYTNEKVLESPLSLSEINITLDDMEFIRCHNSYIVAMQYIVGYKRERIVMKNNISIPVSRTYQKCVRKEFIKWTKRQTE